MKPGEINLALEVTGAKLVQDVRIVDVDLLGRADEAGTIVEAIWMVASL